MLLIALALRIGMLGVDVRLHPDEALFAAQARLIPTQGDWLLRTTDLDKPPLTFYVTALAFKLLPVSEFAARLPNVLFSGASVALVYALTCHLYRDRGTALIAMLLMALSPYNLAFSATVFTDIQATFWVLAACVLAVRDRWLWAGVAAALIFAAKSTALLFVPLILALGIAQTAQSNWRWRDLGQRVGMFLLPLFAGLMLLLLWDAARAPRSFFDLGYTRNNPGRLIRSDEVIPRLNQWGHWLHYATGSRLLNGGLLAAALLWMLARLRARTRAATTSWLIAGYSLAFVGWHWLVAFNTFDRYLHSLIPFLLILGAHMIAEAWHWLGARPAVLLAILVTLTGAMSPAVGIALRGDAPLGGDQGTHTGIDALARYLNTELAGQKVYDHWLGWELAFYLGPDPGVELRYKPLPEALADDMQAVPRYFAAPSPTHAAPWIAALHRADIQTVTVYHDQRHGFTVYRLSARQH